MFRHGTGTMARTIMTWHGMETLSHGNDVAWHGIALEWLVAWVGMHGRACGMALERYGCMGGHGTYGTQH